jgi:hypothetical protein
MSVQSAAARLFNGDVSIFAGETAQVATGWLDHPRQLEETLATIENSLTASSELRHENTILIGMGGSSAPAAMWARANGSANLSVLDTSNPDSVDGTSFEGVNLIASSKSGTTIETVTLLAWALSHGLAAQDLTIITDPGTTLEELGHSLGARVVTGDERTGGRFGALSVFGLFPAVVAGWTNDELVNSLGRAIDLEQFTQWFSEGAVAPTLSNELEFLGLSHSPGSGTGELWLEQLVAESTGKSGRGVIPVVVADASDVAPKRSSMARDIFAWHVRTAGLAWRLEVDPFNQPDVELAKRNVFEELRRDDSWRARTTVSSEDLVALDRAGYVALQIYGPLDLDESVQNLRGQFARRFTHVTAALGPRFLHSTGQLHKGGPSSMVAVQVQVRPTTTRQRISGRNFSFAELHGAQARADAAALRAARRRVVELCVEDLHEVAEAFDLVSTMDQ